MDYGGSLSILFLLPEYIKAGVGGISIGTNDLTQLILGVNREQGELAQMLDERHPAIIGAIAQIIQMAQAGGSCSICWTSTCALSRNYRSRSRLGNYLYFCRTASCGTNNSSHCAEQRLILAAARATDSFPIKLSQLA